MVESFPHRYDQINELMARLGEATPGPMQAFAQLHHAASQDGVLSARVKELIALAIAISVRCDGCIAYHVHDALEAGASHDEIAETIGVAVLMGGEPAVVYGAQALEAIDQFAGVPA